MLWIAKINRQRAIFNVLYSKQAFLNNENIGLKNPQNWHFSMDLIKKLEILLTIRFMQNTPREKYLLKFSLENKPF